MRLSRRNVKKACKQREMRLKDALGGAGVSRTAYYSLLRNDSVLPKSLLALADFLEVKPVSLLEETVGPELRAWLLLRKLERVLAQYPEANRENVRHTLLLLEEPPVDRLERGLSRGRALDLHW
jgi:transcriptional regulator with XRE-family HTH domain